MSANKLQPSDASVDEFLAGLSEQKRQDSQTLISMMREITGLEPVLWGTIVGFGSQHYRYESGREGDMPLVAFSPRKANLTIYINEGFADYGELLAQLGKHTTSVSCLYVKKLAEIDLGVLQQIIQKSYDHGVGGEHGI